MQSNLNRVRTNVSEQHLRVVEDRRYFKRTRFNRAIETARGIFEETEL